MGYCINKERDCPYAMTITVRSCKELGEKNEGDHQFTGCVLEHSGEGVCPF